MSLRSLSTAVFVGLALVAGFIGATAYADYRHLGCPAANQCSDAFGAMQFAAVIGVSALLLIAVILILPRKADRQRGEVNA